jgi:hypothetical protein
MAKIRSCPSCGRPNALTAERCLYCSVVFPRSEALVEEALAEESGFLPELVTGDLEPLQSFLAGAASDRSGNSPVAESPSGPHPDSFGSPDEALASGLSRGGGPFGPREAALRFILLPDSRYARQLEPMRQAIHETLDIDLYTAAQALQKEIPSYLGSTPNPDVGKFIVEPLRDLGIRILMIERERWLEGTLPERVVRITVDDPLHVSFEREDGSSLELARGSVRWAALADIQSDGSLPSIGEAKGREAGGPGLGLEERSYQLLDLFRRDDRRPIRIRSDRFDFSFLGGQINLSANLNLRKLLSFLTRDPSNRELVVPLDEHFRKVPHLPGSAVTGAGGGGASINRRELEFTEYGLLLDARHHF